MTDRPSQRKLSSTYQPTVSNVWMKLLAFGLIAFALFGLAGILLLAPSFINGSLIQADLAQDDRISVSSPTTAMIALIEIQPTTTSPLPKTSDIPPPATPTMSVEPGCQGWEQVSLALVGQEICVQGTYLSEYRKDDGVYVMVFSEQAGAFQVWSSKRPFSYYLQTGVSKCVIVRGWVMTSGVRPFIMLGKGGRMETCP